MRARWSAGSGHRRWSTSRRTASPAYNLVQNFNWTNADQNVVAKYIADDGMDPEEAAQKSVDENPDKVDAWIG